MTQQASRSLPQIVIAEPCHADWSGMAGDDRKRFCQACGMHVHNLSEMSTLEAEQLLTCRQAGRLCVRFHVAPDGTPITRDHPQANLLKQAHQLDYAVPVRRSRWCKVLPFVGIAIGAATALVAWFRPVPKPVTGPILVGALAAPMGRFVAPATQPTTAPSTQPISPSMRCESE